MKYLVFPLALMASQATAQATCYPTEDAHNIASSINLSPDFSALTRDGYVIEIFTDKANGGWIMLETYSTGVSCMIVGGQYYKQEVAEPLGQDG